MASLKKPDCCPSCNGTDLHKEKSPERWICSCGVVAATRGEKPKTGVCRVCKKTRDEVPFDNHGNICRSCKSNYNRSYRGKNWDKLAQQHRDSYQANKKQRQAAVRTAYQRSPEAFMRYLYRTLTRPSRIRKTRAGKLLNSRRLAILNDVQITLDYLISLYHKQDGKCAITGVKMCHVFGQPNTISIDRIDSSKGYTPDNVHLVCQWVNLAKSKYSLSVFKCSLKSYLNNRIDEIMQSAAELPREYRHIHFYLQKFSNRPVRAEWFADNEHVNDGYWETIVTQLTDPSLEWKEPYEVEAEEKRREMRHEFERAIRKATNVDEWDDAMCGHDFRSDIPPEEQYDLIHVAYMHDGIRVFRYFRDGEYLYSPEFWRFIPKDAGEDFYELLDEAMTLPLKPVI